MKTILFVDKDEAARRTLCAYAARLGHSSLEASDCHEAMPIMKTSHVDLVFVDLNITDLHYCMMLEQYRRCCADVPVIICSSSVESMGEVEFMYARTSFPHISKPVSFDAFIRSAQKAFAATGELGG